MPPTTSNYIFKINYEALDFFPKIWHNKYMDLKQEITQMRNGLDEDLRNLADEMEALDPASKDFEDLDIEYNFISGQIVGLNYVLSKMGE